MPNEHEKGIIELFIFEEFSRKASLYLVNGSARKSDPNQGKPDIFCLLSDGPVYFELTEACSPEMAAALNGSSDDPPIMVEGTDVTEETVKKKLQKTYQVAAPVELLVYTNGRTYLTDEVIAAKIQAVLTTGHGQYRRIWLYGDEVVVLYPALNPDRV